VNDLRDGVNTGICSTGTDGFDRLVGNLGQRIFKDALYADTVPLALPAVVARAVVLETECDAKGFACGAYAKPECFASWRARSLKDLTA
jgi:hypothetical protein